MGRAVRSAPDMDLTSPVLPVIGIFLLAGLIQAAVGFGSALVAMPLLVLVMDIQTATPLVGIVVLSISALILIWNWRSVVVGDAWRLILASVLGIPFGLMLLKWAPEAIVKGILGAVLIGFGLYRLITPKLPDLKGSGWLWFSGLISGVLGGAYNTNGPPIVIYATLRRWSPERFRATLQLVWLASGVFIAGGQGLAGLWNPTVFRLIAYALPAVAVGVFLGSRAGRHIPHGVFNRIVYGLLVVMGVFTFV